MARKSEASMYDEPEYHEAETEVQSFNGFEIDSDVSLGNRMRGTRQAKYPFDALGVGQSFHVPATQDMPKPGVTLAGAVTNANLKWSHEDPSGRTETKKVSVFERDEDGKRVRNADGGYVKIGEQDMTSIVRVQDRHFTIRSCGLEDPRGSGARVFRDL